MKSHITILVAVMTLSILACGVSRAGSDRPTEAPAPEPTAVPTPTEVQGEPFISAPNIAMIRLQTDVQGVGEKPLLVWDAVPGASRYQLIVFDEGGEPYWAWEGTKTQVYMGGTDTQPPADSSGPSIGAGYSWTVVAYGSDEKVLAASNLRPISP